MTILRPLRSVKSVPVATPFRRTRFPPVTKLVDATSLSIVLRSFLERKSVVQNPPDLMGALGGNLRAAS